MSKRTHARHDELFNFVELTRPEYDKIIKDLQNRMTTFPAEGHRDQFDMDLYNKHAAALFALGCQDHGEVQYARYFIADGLVNVVVPALQGNTLLMHYYEGYALPNNKPIRRQS